MPIQITGVGRTLQAMKKMERQVATKLADGLNQSAKIILKKSQKYVPVDTGDLKESGRTVVTGEGLGAVATVEYGGPTAPHAFIVHEVLDVFHEPPTQAKYLSRALTEVRGTITSLMGRQIKAGATQS